MDAGGARPERPLLRTLLLETAAGALSGALSFGVAGLAMRSLGQETPPMPWRNVLASAGAGLARGFKVAGGRENHGMTAWETFFEISAWSAADPRFVENQLCPLNQQ